MNFRHTPFGTLLAFGVTTLGAPLVAGSLEEVQAILHTLATGPYLGEVVRFQQDPPNTLRIIGNGFGKDPNKVQVRLDGNPLPFQLANDSLLGIMVPENTSPQARLQVQAGGHASLTVNLGTPQVHKSAAELLVLPDDEPMLLIETNQHQRSPNGVWRTLVSGKSVQLSTAEHNRMVVTAFELSEETVRLALTKAQEAIIPLHGGWDLPVDGKKVPPAQDSKAANPAPESKSAKPAARGKQASSNK